jgi:putative sigma-54 modulation protein
MINSSKLNVQVLFKGMSSSDAVREYAEKRATKLTKHVHDITNCHFVFQVEREDHVVQMHVVSGDFEARAESRAETMYAAIDEATDKILHQTRKFKEKVTSHAGIPHHNTDGKDPT